MITSEKLKATKITLVGEEGKSTFYAYGQTAKEIMEKLGAVSGGEKAATPKRRGRKPKAAAPAPAVA